MTVPAVSVTRELNAPVSSFSICPDGTNLVRGTGPVLSLLTLTFAAVWGYFAWNVWKHFLFGGDSHREMLTVTCGACLLASSTNSRFAAEEGKHALVGILLSLGINLSI